MDLSLSSLRGLPALSIRQPWAWLIVHGSKRFENRAWGIWNPGRRFTGRFLIHAAKGLTRVEYSDAEAVALEHGQPLPAFETLERGGIVGVATVVRWHDRPPQMPFAFGSGFELTDVQALPFQACKGSLGFFKPQLA